MLVAQSKKTDCNTKISKILKKLTNHNHDKTITSQEFNKLTTENFSARLKQANLVTKTDFDDKLKCLNQKINSNKTKYLLVENELKNYKQLLQFILEEKVISKKMVHKVIQNFSQCTDILKGLVELVVVVLFIFGNLKDCLMKILQLLVQVIIKLTHNYFGVKTRVEFKGSCLKQDKITYHH